MISIDSIIPRFRKPDPFDDEAYDLDLQIDLKKKRAEERLKRIAEFCHRKKIELSIKNVEDTKILGISDQDLDITAELPVELIADLKDLLKAIKNNCLPLSKKLKDEYGFTFIINGVQTKNITYGNHYLPVIEVGSNFYSVDLTAGHSVDASGGRYDVLIIQAGSYKELLKRVIEVYGGKWKVYPS